MSTYRIDVAYDGSGFRGYARQQGLRTVQGELEDALATYLKRPVVTSVAGRTDAGVHAHGQVISFAFDGDIDPRRFTRGINGIIGPEIAVRSIVGVDDGFSARFSATWRRYRYLLDMGAPDPLSRGFVWQVARSLDVEKMRTVLQASVGEHDFSSFCRSVEGKSNVRLVTEARLDVVEDRLIVWIQANAFCHQMVRSLVGYIYDVGRGFTAAETVHEVIEARDRSRIVTVAPPHGLTLWEVGYDS